MSETKFDQWAIVDLMGHQRYIGRVTEQVIAGTGFVRVDVPEAGDTPAWTKLVGTASIYAITPVSEAIARKLAASRQQRPVQAYELRAAEHERPCIGAAAATDEGEFDDDEDDGGPW